MIEIQMASIREHNQRNIIIEIKWNDQGDIAKHLSNQQS